jgi:uncharacterized membrane protein required for colicin V production
MALYDLVMVVILIVAAYRGGTRGIVYQLAAIATRVCCFLFAGRLAPQLATLLPGLEPPWNRWSAMFLLYVGFSFITFGTARILHGWIEKAKIEDLDRHLGAVFGLMKGLVFCLVVTFFLVTSSDRMRDTVVQSASGYAAAIIMDRLHPVMPDELHEMLEPYIHQLDRPDMELRFSEDGHDVDGNRAPAGDSGANHAKGAGAVGPFDDERQAFSELIKKLRGFFDAELAGKVNRALEHTRPADRPELLQKLNSGVIGMNQAVADEWKNGKPARQPSNSSRRTQLLKEIAAIHSDFPKAQEAMIEEIESSLAGLPDPVSLAVLSDWHADLWAIKPDPDTGTDHTTPLDARIVRQLEAARIPVASLGAVLRDRLTSVRR